MRVLPFKWIERTYGLLGLMMIVFAVALVAVHPPWVKVASGLVPHVPSGLSPKELLIFSYFCVRADAQPKVLKWGILGAMVMRLIMIGLGAFLLHQFSWIIYVFGAFLIFTGVPPLCSARIFDRDASVPSSSLTLVVCTRISRVFFFWTASSV